MGQLQRGMVVPLELPVIAECSDGYGAVECLQQLEEFVPGVAVDGVRQTVSCELHEDGLDVA